MLYNIIIDIKKGRVMTANEHDTLQQIYNLTQDNSSWNWSSFGQGVEAIINSFVGVILIVLLLLFSIRWLEKRFKIDKINYFTEGVTKFIIENTPSNLLRGILSKLFYIQAETFVLLPKATIRNYQHLGYQLNGLNHFLENEPEYKSHIKIILIDNSTIETTKEDIGIFIQSLSNNKRYIIIATMSDIFDTLLVKSDNKFKDKSYKRMVKIIGTLASQSERYKKYEGYENIIRLSPPDFDEARKATSNIVTKLISSFCPNEHCDYHKTNNIILISSNAYGDAVKKSFSKLFTEHKEEFDASTNFHLKGEELKNRTYRFTYHYDTQEGIVEDEENDYTFNQLLEENMHRAINTIFIIGYEPNISNILKQIDNNMKEKRFDDDTEFSILISATASVRAWRESIIETIHGLEIKNRINEINFIKIKYPKFKDDTPKESKSKESKSIHFKLFEVNHKNPKSLNPSKLELKKEEIEKIIYKEKMNYINGFIYMSLEFVQQIDKDWDINLLSLKEKLFHNKDRNDKDITGVKILSSGDSINHFKVKALKWKEEESE